VNLKIRNSKFKTFVLVFGLLTMACGLIGCDAFVRKFTRKPKKENLPQDEMVVAPVAYNAPDIGREELYRQYFLYWKAWHNELIDSLSRNNNHKKQLDCAIEAIKNLEQVGTLLNERSRKKAAAYIEQLTELKKSIEADPYGNSLDAQRRNAELLQKGVSRDLSYTKIKDGLL
jgi:hypothetical protein